MLTLYDIIYDIISLFVISIILYPFTNHNDTILQIGSILAIFLHFVIKMATGGLYPNIFKRPDGACDCGIFNDGGLVETQSGFPSGHVTSTSYLFTYLLLKKKHYDNFDIILYVFPSFAMGVSRYMRGCHNIIQIITGYVLGSCIAYFTIQYENNKSSKCIVKRYRHK